MNRTARIGLWSVVTAASVGLHLAAFGGLGSGPHDRLRPRPSRPPTLVEMTVAPPPPPPVVDTPAEAAAPAPRAPRPVTRRVARVNNPAATPPPAAAPVAETPADFTGTTLTNNGAGAGWASATGNGEAMRGPVGRPGARVTGRSVEGASDGPAIPVVGVGDLSQPPRAPDLAAALERLYPGEARRKGLAGSARVRLRVMPDGAIRELAVVSESTGGFGEACRQTLKGSRWSAPIDRGGQPVSTFVQYTCRFEVR